MRIRTNHRRKHRTCRAIEIEKKHKGIPSLYCTDTFREGTRNKKKLESTVNDTRALAESLRERKTQESSIIVEAPSGIGATIRILNPPSTTLVRLPNCSWRCSHPNGRETASHSPLFTCNVEEKIIFQRKWVARSSAYLLSNSRLLFSID